MAATDLLGNDLNEVEREVLDLYHRLKALASRDDLSPCVERNARHALAIFRNCAGDLDLVDESLLDSHGV